MRDARKGHCVETVFGSLWKYTKGGVQSISVNPKHYAALLVIAPGRWGPCP